MRRRLQALWRQRSIRLRLTATYGALFLICGAGLLTFTYVLVEHTTGDSISYKAPDGSTVVVNINNGPIDPGTGAPEGTPNASGSIRVDGLDGPTGMERQTQEQMHAQAARLRTQAQAQHDAEMSQLLENSIIALAVVAVLSIGLGWVVAGRVLRPLRTMTGAVQQISATNLHHRLDVQGPADELKQLGDTFDALLGRLEAAFDAQRMFVANASHEMRTPLARQRAIGQVTLADPEATANSLREAHRRILAAGEQQEQMIEALLTLSRGQAGVERREPVDFAVLAAHACSARQDDLRSRGIACLRRLDPAPTVGDARLLERLVTNLVANAVVHNRDDAGEDAAEPLFIEVSTGTRHGEAVLTVDNSGPLVPSEAVDRLVEPFRRITPDRVGNGKGSGLGLSIVRAICDAHGGRLTIRPRPAGGLSIEVSLPAREGEMSLPAREGGDAYLPAGLAPGQTKQPVQ